MGDVAAGLTREPVVLAVELRDPARTQAVTPGAGAADQVASAAMRRGMFGPRPLGGTTLVLAPPLIITRAQAEQAVNVLDAALSQVEAESGLAAGGNGETRRESAAASQ